MSNFLAIATVTATLSQTVQAAVGADVPGATVTMLRPDRLGNEAQATGVNIYLYQVTSNAAYRNADVPTRRPDGGLAQRPQVALDLHYLLSFYGDEGQLEPQRLLGSVVRTLHARSVLTRQMIRDTVANPTFHFLETSNLADAIELVKFSPLPLNLEELSKLWSVFFQIPYTLSVAYQATVILLQSEEMPQVALPVRRRNLYVMPFRQPIIEGVMSQEGVDAPIVASSTLIIRGMRLRGDVTQVIIGGVEVTPQDVSEAQIRLQLPADSLRAGVQGVQVVHHTLMGTPAVPHRGVESNLAAFVLRPTITAVTVSNPGGSGSELRSADVTVQVNPTIGVAQRVVLLLNELLGDEAAAYTFVAKPRNADANAITIPVSGVKAGEYLVRVQVDGAESPLDVDTNPDSPTFNQYIGPKMTLGDALRATDIQLRARQQRNSFIVIGRVTVQDQNGTAIEGVTVEATWMLPDGTIQHQTAVTKEEGTARFNTENGRGTYTLTVINIIKEGYIFDRSNSLLSRSITQ